MADLILPLNAQYFNQIKAGTKTEEYRLCNSYWRKRIEGKTYDRIVLTLGYPKKDDTERRLVLPWKGYTKRTITHPHFGENPVAVYAIDVNHSEKFEQ
jgi:ASC-1-like (ASCH) protein